VKWPVRRRLVSVDAEDCSERELWQRGEDHSGVRMTLSNMWTQLVVSQHSAGLSSRYVDCSDGRTRYPLTLSLTLSYTPSSDNGSWLVIMKCSCTPL